MQLQNGQSLIEVIIAVGIGVVVLTAVTIASLNALNNAQFAKNQNKASYYADQAMEIARQQLKQQTSITDGNYCLQGDTLVPSASCVIDGTFTSTVSINRTLGTQCPTTLAAVNVSVAWTDGKCGSTTNCHKSQLTSCLPYY